MFRFREYMKKAEEIGKNGGNMERLLRNSRKELPESDHILIQKRVNQLRRENNYWI